MSLSSAITPVMNGSFTEIQGKPGDALVVGKR